MRLLLMLVTIAAFGIIPQAMALTVTADDILTASGLTYGGETPLDLGTHTLSTGGITFTGLNNAVATNLSYFQTGTQTSGIGLMGGSGNEPRNVNDNEELILSFTAPTEITEIEIGRLGPSDGSFALSGFGSDPGATVVNSAYDGSGAVAGSAGYNAGTDTLTINATTIFGISTITFASATSVSSLTLFQPGSGNDGMAFDKITFSASGAPVITTQPVSQIAAIGGSAVFSVQATSDSPITYSWYWTTAEMPNPGADVLKQSGASNTLNLSGLQVADEGYYYCVLQNDAPVDTISDMAALGITRLLAHWTLDEAEYLANGFYPDSAAVDPVSQNATPAGTPVFVDGVAPLLSNEAVIIDSSNGHATAGNWDPSKYTNQFTINCWLYWNGTVGQQNIVCKRDSITEENDRWQVQIDSQSSIALQAWGQAPLQTNPLIPNQWTMVTAVFDGTNARLYINGLLQVEDAFAVADGKDAVVRIGQWSGQTLDGNLDDVRIYNYALTDSGIMQVHYDTSGKSVCNPVNAVVFDVAGPDGLGPDCIVDLYDFVEFSREWIGCGLSPSEACQ